MVRPRILEEVSCAIVIASAFCFSTATRAAGGNEPDAPPTVETKHGVCVVLGLPEANDPGSVIGIAEGNELLVYFQSPDSSVIESVREAAERAGLLGKRVFVEQGDLRCSHRRQPGR